MIANHPEHGLIKVTDFHPVTIEMIRTKIQEIEADLAEAKADLERALQIGGE